MAYSAGLTRVRHKLCQSEKRYDSVSLARLPKRQATPSRPIWASGIAISLAVLCTSTSQATSFDCKKAATSIEHSICASPELSQLDEDLGDAYLFASQVVPHPATLRGEQRAWLKRRNKCMNGRHPCSTLAEMYRARISELSKIGDSACQNGVNGSSAVATCAYRQNQLAQQAFAVSVPSEVAPFVEYGSTAVYLKQGDVNGEGLQDYLLVVSGDIDPGTRSLLVLVREPDGSLKLAARNDTLIECEAARGMGGFYQVTATGNGFEVEDVSGSSGVDQTLQYKFKYFAREKTWILVEADREFDDPRSNPPEHTKHVDRPFEHGKIIRFSSFDGGDSTCGV